MKKHAVVIADRYIPAIKIVVVADANDEGSCRRTFEEIIDPRSRVIESIEEANEQ